jgi:hypothetical protein
MSFNGDTWIMRICIVGFNGNIMKIEWNHVCDLLGAAVYNCSDRYPDNWSCKNSYCKSSPNGNTDGIP